MDSEKSAIVEVEQSLPAESAGIERLRLLTLRVLAAGLLMAVALVIGVRLGIEDSTVDDGASAEEDEPEETWTCSMHPQIRMPSAGQCPICGMELVLAEDLDEDDDEEHGPIAPRVSLSATQQTLGKIELTTVVRTEPRADVRLVGRVDYNENGIHAITPWTAGRIDELFVRVTGAEVRKGQTVALLYSPEIYEAMRELLVAIKQGKALAGGLHGSANLAAATVEASRERLELLGVSKSRIREIERTQKAPRQVKIRSKFSGTVLERNVEEGDYVRAGTALFRVADLSRLWVQIDAYESDLPHLSLGQSVRLSVESMPEQGFTGTVEFIDPVIDRQTRTARVRVHVDNGEGRLRPGMFVEAVIEADVGRQLSFLVIPATAALFTGRSSVVYVAVPEEARTYELRELRLGPRAGPVYPVLAGLSEGDRVVTRGVFVLDAHLQLQGGRSMMTRGDDRDLPKLGVRVSAELRAQLESPLSAYLDAVDELAKDDFPAARLMLVALAESAESLEAISPRRGQEAWMPIRAALVRHAKHAASVEREGEVRSAFEHVSMQILDLLRVFGNPTEDPLVLALCPMAFDDRGAQWVQRGEVITNPYYGASMLRCGEIRAIVLAGERLAVSPTDSAPPPAAAMSGHQH